MLRTMKSSTLMTLLCAVLVTPACSTGDSDSGGSDDVSQADRELFGEYLLYILGVETLDDPKYLDAMIPLRTGNDTFIGDGTPLGAAKPGTDLTWGAHVRFDAGELDAANPIFGCGSHPAEGLDTLCGDGGPFAGGAAYGYFFGTAAPTTIRKEGQSFQLSYMLETDDPNPYDSAAFPDDFWTGASAVADVSGIYSGGGLSGTLSFYDVRGTEFNHINTTGIAVIGQQVSGVIIPAADIEATGLTPLRWALGLHFYLTTFNDGACTDREPDVGELGVPC